MSAPEPVGNLYIAGAGGHGRELHAYIADLRKSGWGGNFKGYLDDGLAPGEYGRLNVVGPIESLHDRQAHYLTAFGDNALRRKMVRKIEAHYQDRLVPWTLIHPAAHFGEDIEIGAGSCIAPGAIFTANSKLGSHCIVNVKASVSHDCVLGDFVNVNPGATICGWVNVGEGAYIGAGAVVKDRVNIGAWSVIGAGTVVIRDIPANTTAVGVPARVVR